MSSQFNLKEYHQRKQTIQEVLSVVAAVADEMGSKGAREQIEQLQARLEADLFHIVVVGEFSHGKSTLINALLGESLLPSSKAPTTAVLTKILNGSELSITLKLRDGQQRTITEKSFPTFLHHQSPILMMSSLS